MMSVGGANSSPLNCDPSSTFAQTMAVELLAVVDLLGLNGIDFDIEKRDGCTFHLLPLVLHAAHG